MALLLIRLMSTAILTSLIVPTVWSRALTKSHRGVRTPDTQLEYAQSPVDFLNSKGFNPVVDDNNIANRHHTQHPHRSHNNYNTPIPSTSSSSFDGALPYDKYVPQAHSPSNNVGSKSQPAVTLYNDIHTNNDNNNNNINNNQVQAFETTKPYTNTVSTTAAANPNQYLVQQNEPINSQHKQHFNSASQYFPKKSNVQGKLNFDLFNDKNYGQDASKFGRSPPQFDRTPSTFGRDSAYVQPNPSADISGRNIFQRQQRFPYDMSSSSHDQVRNTFNGHDLGYDNEGYRPILSQGFSVPTTYQGEQKTDILPNEAFSSVTDPKTDKRVAINSYVPSNNFVNPTNFLIPTEDKYNMISRIFGGFQVPAKEQEDKPLSPHQHASSASRSYDNTNANDNNNNNYNTARNPNDQKVYGNNYNNNQNADYGSSKHADGSYGGENVASSSQRTNQGQYFTGTKSLAKPGFGRGFEDQGAFSYSPSQSPRQGYDKDSIFGVRDDSPTLLFSDFTYNNPLSLNQFRSKNLLGDENFGKTDYDKNRLTSDSIYENNNKNYYQSADFFAPSSTARVTGNVSGSNGYKQIGADAVTTGRSYDKSYNNNRGYDKTYDDNSQKSVGGGYAPSKNYGYSDQSVETDAYDDGEAYSDGDGYSNSYRYSDGGSDSDYVATDDNNERGYEKSYQNSDDHSDMDSYNDAQGYDNVYYDGNKYDVTDGYTDNVNYDTSKKQDSNQGHYSDGNESVTNGNYRQGVDKIASALAASGAPTVQPYRGLTKPITDDLPNQASYQPFNVNRPVVE